ncbi:MAG: sugar ABC transporter substrate-binding protein [Planctomyces sp.]|nr:sugar ABC transporter substrate-binding protein [Planctomyces sp.]
MPHHRLNSICAILNRIVAGLVIAGGLFLASGCESKPAGMAGPGGASSGKPLKFAYVTNGVAEFWNVAEAGVRQAEKDLNAAGKNVKVEVRHPPDGVVDQKRMVQELLTVGVDGVAISPIDPDNQGDLLAEIAKETIFITNDSDAPKSERLVYIGMDNYLAGRQCGEMIKEAMPEGAKVMIFVGRLGQLNAKQRRQGIIDELLGRSIDPERYDEPGKELVGDKYTVLDTRTDDFDLVKAKALAQDAITRHQDLNCMVGLFAYNPPKLIDAVKDAGMVGKIQVLGFDEDEGTLQGIRDGVMYGTCVQNPYQYGYQSIVMLDKLKAGDKSVIPADKFVNIPARKITKANVDEFWKELNKLLGKAEEVGKPAEGK